MQENWLAEEAAAFSGWDFSHLAGRWVEGALPWDYAAEVRARLRPQDRLLDMGTGGGEFLLTLGHPYALTAVTEAYPPNIALCRNRLAPLGIDVRGITDGDDTLPFADGAFNIVINRHESYDVAEVRRVLRPGGLFITQQVGGENNIDLAKRVLPIPPPARPAFHLAGEVDSLRAHGFTVHKAEEHFLPLRFFDIGAVVYFAKIIPWEFPDFSVRDSLAQLMRLQVDMDRDGAVVSREHRFLLVAQK